MGIFIKLKDVLNSGKLMVGSAYRPDHLVKGSAGACKGNMNRNT